MHILLWIVITMISLKAYCVLQLLCSLCIFHQTSLGAHLVCSFNTAVLRLLKCAIVRKVFSLERRLLLDPSVPQSFQLSKPLLRSTAIKPWSLKDLTKVFETTKSKVGFHNSSECFRTKLSTKVLSKHRSHSPYCAQRSRIEDSSSLECHAMMDMRVSASQQSEGAQAWKSYQTRFWIFF